MKRSKFRDLRKKRKLTLLQMGELCGVSEGYLSRFERGLDSARTIRKDIKESIEQNYGGKIEEGY